MRFRPLDRLTQLGFELNMSVQPPIRRTFSFMNFSPLHPPTPPPPPPPPPPPSTPPPLLSPPTPPTPPPLSLSFSLFSFISHQRPSFFSFFSFPNLVVLSTTSVSLSIISLF